MLDLNADGSAVREFSEESLIEHISRLNTAEIETVILLGHVRSGKTTKLLKLIDRISALGLRVGGICQPEDGGVYFARDLETAECRWIARRENDSVFFNPDTFDWAAQKIIHARKSCDVLAVDEIGRLESLGKGHLPAVLQPVKDEKVRLRLLAVRDDALNGVRRFLPPVCSVVRVVQMTGEK
ncbi:MAG: nucleoside-triphosphatase [Alphaproteobacteria bacterium]